METRITQTIAVDALAVRLGVSPWTVRTWLRQGRVPFFKIGRRVLIKAEDVEALLDANYKPATRPA
jgi:excisionase family DNA binding protein